MAGELERTRTDLVIHTTGAYPPGTRMLHGERRDLEAYMAENGARAVGVWRPLPGGGGQIPVVYVSKRAKAKEPFLERHGRKLLLAGLPLLTLSGLALLVAWVGWAWFIGGVLAGAAAIATLVRWSRGGGGRTGNINININANTGRR